jgi:hypothetical protein
MHQGQFVPASAGCGSRIVLFATASESSSRFEAEGLDSVLEIAARCPAARLGGVVEVRPLVHVHGLEGTA